jgi:hypothetical protein
MFLLYSEVFEIFLAVISICRDTRRHTHGFSFEVSFFLPSFNQYWYVSTNPIETSECRTLWTFIQHFSSHLSVFQTNSRFLIINIAL